VYAVAVAVRAPADALAARRILVLGARLGEDGSIGAIYRARLERARVLAARYSGAEIVLLGGRTALGCPSEAAAGRDWLVARGILPERIRGEDRSRHTLENLVLYRQSFASSAGGVVLLTSRFHLARSSLLARALGIEHRPCAAEACFSVHSAPLRLLLWEAFLIHWYLTGSRFARLTGNKRMTARIS
jgi:uncharacterized SAM-binding protein YcdF (DUF218 family)